MLRPIDDENLTIEMAAPRRATQGAPKRTQAPVAQPLAQTASPYQGGLSNTTAQPLAPIVTVGPNAAKQSQDMLMLKLSQGVMMGIGFLAIWGGIFSVAFDEEATNDNFLVLFIGGLASFLVSIGIIELQSKKNNHRLYDIHNYFLGIAFFFSTIGVLWGTRYMMGVMTGTFDLSWFGNPAEYTETDWAPNANGIYAQLTTCILLTFGHFRLLKRYSGDTGFGWGVATYAPMAILLAGVGPWIRWSGNEVSYELGISIIVISIVSMEMALRSNKALNFGVVAFASGLVPLVYELLNDVPDADKGGALSLMVFIIALQGYYAARSDLRKEVMERASFFLVGQVVVAILVTRSGDLNLILGPFRSADYSSLAPYVSLPVALWCMMLLAYFPAVIQQRVPWMPIGLAVSLVALPTATSTVPWTLSIVMIPYMLFISKVAREWVINITVLSFGISYLLTDLGGIMDEITPKETFGGTILHIILPIFIVLISEMGRRQEKITTAVSLGLLGTVVCSRAILDPEWFMPWLFIAYMFYLTLDIALKCDDEDFKGRKELTLSAGFTSFIILVLGLFDKLELPPGDFFDNISPDGLEPQFLILGIALYSLSRIIATKEFDLGSLFAWLDQGSSNSPSYDPETNSWVAQAEEQEKTLDSLLEKMWTPLARISLLCSLLLFSLSIESVTAYLEKPQWILLIAIPVGTLVWEIYQMDRIDSKTRAAGVGLLVAIALPVAVQLQEVAFYEIAAGKILIAGILLDLLLVSAPLIVNTIISKRGIDEDGLNFYADATAYVLLLVLATLDSSGGLLFVPILFLVIYRTVQHRHYGTALFAPFAVLVMDSDWFTRVGITNKILEGLPSDIESYLRDMHLGPFAALSGIFVAAHMTLMLFAMYRDSERTSGYQEVVALIWLGLAFLSVLPDGYWLPTIITYLIMSYLWYTENSNALPYMLGILFFSLFIGFDNSDSFTNINTENAWAWSGFVTGLNGVAFALMHQANIFYKVNASDEADQQTQDATALLSQQIASIGFIISYEIFYGIGPLIALIMIGYSTFKKGQTTSLLLFPPLLSFAAVNIMIQGNIGDSELHATMGGAILAFQGIMFTLLSNKDDLVYDWENVEWESNDSFFQFMDRLGIAGVAYSVVGLFLAFDAIDLDSFAYIAITVYLVILGIQGFSEENDARWRRGIGGYGSVLTSFLFTTTIENDLFGAIGVVLMGILALGFGFLFMQRTNTEDIYEQGVLPNEVQTAAPTVEHVETPAVNAVEEAKEEASIVEEDEDVEDEAVEENKVEDEVSAEPVEEVAETPEPVVQTPPSEQVHSGLLMTEEGFAVRLPADSVNNIIKSLEKTPHDGFLPVVAFSPSGQIMLNFESKTSDS